MLFLSGALLLYTAIIVPVQICMWNYDDPCHIFPTLQFDIIVDTFFLVGENPPAASPLGSVAKQRRHAGAARGRRRAAALSDARITRSASARGKCVGPAPVAGNGSARRSNDRKAAAAPHFRRAFLSGRPPERWPGARLATGRRRSSPPRCSPPSLCPAGACCDVMAVRKGRLAGLAFLQAEFDQEAQAIAVRLPANVRPGAPWAHNFHVAGLAQRRLARPASIRPGGAAARARAGLDSARGVGAVADPLARIRGLLLFSSARAGAVLGAAR